MNSNLRVFYVNINPFASPAAGHQVVMCGSLACLLVLWFAYTLLLLLPACFSLRLYGRDTLDLLLRLTSG